MTANFSDIHAATAGDQGLVLWYRTPPRYVSEHTCIFCLNITKKKNAPAVLKGHTFTPSVKAVIQQQNPGFYSQRKLFRGMPNSVRSAVGFSWVLINYDLLPSILILKEIFTLILIINIVIIVIINKSWSLDCQIFI